MTRPLSERKRLTQPDQEPEAEVTQTGRWSYRVRIRHGLLRYGEWTTLGRRWAESKARRALRAYRLREEREANSTIIRDRP